ncbi:MAG: alpha-galactosidase [Christensenellales bacterium]
MAHKIVFIGAGSLTFTRNLVRDLLTFPAFADAELALVDINPTHLAQAKMAVEHIVEAGNYPATVTASTDRRELLPGAEGVVSTILAEPAEGVAVDLGIPLKYGISTNIGDTRGPQGIFRFLRTWPVMREILLDIEELCPEAVFLNYTNPMAMLCRAMQETSPVRVTGLCHSVQGTAEMLARWIGAPMEEISYICAGINHQAFYLEYKWNGKDAYPLIREAVKRPEIYNEEQVRNDMFRHLGYYVTESSGHNSEYVAWYRKRPDLLEKYCTHGTGWNPGIGVTEERIQRRIDRENYRTKLLEDWKEQELDLKRGHEYAAYIFNACFGDNTMFQFNGNVRNFGLIDNLPYGACVEVPVLASLHSIQPMHVGALPPQLALLTSISSQIEEMAVKAAFTGDPELVVQACFFDPLTSALLSLEEIRSMVTEMLEAGKDWLPMFKHTT